MFSKYLNSDKKSTCYESALEAVRCLINEQVDVLHSCIEHEKPCTDNCWMRIVQLEPCTSKIELSSQNSLNLIPK